MNTDAPPPGATQQESIGELLSGLVGDLQQLIRGEVALAKTEIREPEQGDINLPLSNGVTSAPHLRSSTCAGTREERLPPGGGSRSRHDRGPGS